MTFWSNQLMMQQFQEQQAQQWNAWQAQMGGNPFLHPFQMSPHDSSLQPHGPGGPTRHPFPNAAPSQLVHAKSPPPKKPRPTMAPCLVQKNEHIEAMQDSPSQVKCRYGKRCSRKDCWHQHPDGRNIDLNVGPEISPSSPTSGRFGTQAAPAVLAPQPEQRADEFAHEDPPSPAKDIYSLLRSTHSPWPRRITMDGKLGDLEYAGSGLAMHFLHPLHPRMLVSLDDLDSVLTYLRSQGILASEPPKLVSPGVLQAKFGHAKGAGNIQVYPSATGRSTGNARLNCGQTGQVQIVRSALLKSQWFWDAGPSCPSPLDNCGKLSQMADGRIVLQSGRPQITFPRCRQTSWAGGEKGPHGVCQGMRHSRIT